MIELLLALPAGDPPPTDGGGGAGGGLGGFLPFMLVLVIVMLFMPLFSRKERNRRKRLGTLKKHDKVVTSGGIFGTIAAVDEDTVTLEVAKDVRFKIKRTSVFDVDRPETAAKSDAPAARAKN